MTWIKINPEVPRSYPKPGQKVILLFTKLNDIVFGHWDDELKSFMAGDRDSGEITVEPDYWAVFTPPSF